MEDPLWRHIRRGIAEKGNAFFSISWVKSHVSLEEAQTYIDQGTFCQDDFDRNEQADSLAKRGAQEHPVSLTNYQPADDRTVIANIVQRVSADIWTTFFSLHDDAWANDEDQPQAGGPQANQPPQPQEVHWE